MASVNKVILVGNVGVDPEVRYLDGGNSANGQGTKVATFRLATSERYKDRNGNTQENTEWHNIVAWRSNADVAEKFIRKGTQVYIEGRLRTRQWTDQTGNKRYTTEITVDTLQLLGRRPDQEDGSFAAPAAPQSSYQRPATPAAAPAAPTYQAPAPAPAPAAQSTPLPQEPITLEGGDDDFPF